MGLQRTKKDRKRQIDRTTDQIPDAIARHLLSVGAVAEREAHVLDARTSQCCFAAPSTRNSSLRKRKNEACVP